MTPTSTATANPTPAEAALRPHAEDAFARELDALRGFEQDGLLTVAGDRLTIHPAGRMGRRSSSERPSPPRPRRRHLSGDSLLLRCAPQAAMPDRRSLQSRVAISSRG